MAHEHHHHGHTGHDHGHAHGDSGLPELLDLDAEVSAAQFAELTTRVADLAGDHPVRHIVDLGSGTGSGTFALLRQFPTATATAVDTSDDMLRHLTGSAHRHGLAQRITPLRADLDEKWPDVDPADLVWASSSMHHMADPDRVLREIRAALRPGGLLVMIEMEHMPRFLPPGAEGGLEDRCHALAEQIRNEHLPHIGSDWNTRLAAAGLTVREQRTLDVELTAPLPAAAVRYARAALQRFRSDRLSPADQAALDRVLASSTTATT